MLLFFSPLYREEELACVCYHTQTQTRAHLSLKSLFFNTCSYFTLAMVVKVASEEKGRFFSNAQNTLSDDILSFSS